MKKSHISYLARKILIIAFYTSLGTILGALILYINLMQNRPDLYSWHTIHLQEEFTTEQLSEVKNFSDYQQIHHLQDFFLQQGVSFIEKINFIKKKKY